MPFAVTAIYAAILAFLLIWLAMRIGRERQAAKVSLGTGGNAALERAVRAHGNAAEWIPMALILLALAESFATPPWVLHALGIMLVAGRVMHAVYMITDPGTLTLRMWGMLLTVGMMGLTALGLLGHAVVG